MWILAESERVMVNSDTVKGIGVYPTRIQKIKSDIYKFNIEADGVILSQYDKKEDASDDLFLLWEAIGKKDKNFKF